MTQEERHREPIDAESIDIDDADDIVYWTEMFDISLDQLKAAVWAVGPRTESVWRHLQAAGVPC